jgi:hypothetical protein
MVLGRRFKLYFILCVWDRMAEPTIPPVSYVNSNKLPAIQPQNNTSSTNKPYGNLSSFQFNPKALKHMQPIGTRSYGPVKTSQIPSIKKTPYNRPASKPAIPQSLSFFKMFIHKKYIGTPNIEWYKKLADNTKNEIKFLKLYQIIFDATHHNNKIDNADRYKTVFESAKNEYETSSQLNSKSTPGGSRHRNKKQRKHRTRKH